MAGGEGRDEPDQPDDWGVIAHEMLNIWSLAASDEDFRRSLS
jgi:hypothetical protein